MQALITDIKRFAVHDGDGIRTTVFFKGCPLHCVWCHNPETISAKPQLGYYEHKCVLCGTCMAVCPNHIAADGRHFLKRDDCTCCGQCVEACPADALALYGKRISTDTICEILAQDLNFYWSSNGGITLSGGECLLQPEACREILSRMKQLEIHTAVDTCGFVSKRAIDMVLPFTDVFLYDIKAADEDVHIQCTGGSNKAILENLHDIDDSGKQIEVRIPYVPGWNDTQMEKIAKILREFKSLKKIRVLPYHAFADSKYRALNMANTMPEHLPTAAELESVRLLFSSVCEVV